MEGPAPFTAESHRQDAISNDEKLAKSLEDMNHFRNQFLTEFDVSKLSYQGKKPDEVTQMLAEFDIQAIQSVLD